MEGHLRTVLASFLDQLLHQVELMAFQDSEQNLKHVIPGSWLDQVVLKAFQVSGSDQVVLMAFLGQQQLCIKVTNGSIQLMIAGHFNIDPDLYKCIVIKTSMASKQELSKGTR